MADAAAIRKDTGLTKKILARKFDPGTVEILGIGLLASQAAFGLFRKWRDNKRERETTVLKFREGTEEYTWLCAWLAKQPRIENNSTGRSFMTKHTDADTASAPAFAVSESPRNTDGWLLIPDSVQGFVFENMIVSVSRDQSAKDSNDVLSRNFMVHVTTRDSDSIKRLLESIYECGNADKFVEKIPRVMAISRWGDWVEVRKAPSNRKPVLPSGVLETLVSDVSRFLGAAQWYQSVGIPYRRGYLLHGIPGSGKTTTAIALASYLKKDIHILPLEGLKDDQLMTAICTTPRDSIVLIEDIDCATVTHTRSGDDRSEQNGLTLRGLLNSIDGVATPEGRILIATTNARDVIDPALIRPGRFDVEIQFQHADYHQIAELCRRFDVHDEAESIADQWHTEKISMAEVQQRLIERCGVMKK